MTEIKKFHREGTASPNLVDKAKEELGDILWYVTSIADHAGLNLRRDVLFGNLQKLCELYDRPSVDSTTLFTRLLTQTQKNPVISEIESDGDDAASTFQRYQDLAVRSSRHRSLKYLLPFLVRVWVNLGDLFLALEMDLETNPDKKQTIGEVLGDICWYVANIAHGYQLSLIDLVGLATPADVARFLKHNAKRQQESDALQEAATKQTAFRAKIEASRKR